MLMLTGVRGHSSGNDSVHTHRQGKTLSNTFNTYNTFKAPRWTNRTGNGPTLIFSRTRKVLVYCTPSAEIISVWTQILEKSHSLRYVLAFCPQITKNSSALQMCGFILIILTIFIIFTIFRIFIAAFPGAWSRDTRQNWRCDNNPGEVQRTQL